MNDNIKITDTEANRDYLMKQYLRCHEGEVGLLFECRKCSLVGDCPVYGTTNYNKRMLEYCSVYLPKGAEND